MLYLPISWFAVHPVSMNYTNRMVSSDNLGYASYAFEQDKNIGFLPGEVKDQLIILIWTSIPPISVHELCLY